MAIRYPVVALALALSSVGLPAQSSLSIATPPAASASTVIPALVPYSGVAVAVDGRPLSGETYINFLIFKDEHGGTPLWTEGQIASLDTTGRYKVQLGAASSNGLPSDLFSRGEARWLEVQIAGQTIQPRTLLASVPYALKAADAATLGGLPPSAFMLAGSSAHSSIAPATVTPLATGTTVTTSGGTAGLMPVWTGTSTIGNSIVYQTANGIGIGRFPNATLDIGGTSTFRGSMGVSRAGDATTSIGAKSFPILMQSSVYNSTMAKNVLPYFQLQTEPVGNNTASPGATLNFLYYSGVGSAPSESGLYFNGNGTIHFAPGQTFPGGTGTGTITGVTAGTGLTGGGTSGTVTLKVDTTKVPLLAASNTFAGTQTITGNQIVNGNIGIGTASPEGNIDIESTNSGQPLLINAASPGAWAINSFGGPNGGLAGRFVGGQGTSGNTGGGGIAVGGGSTSDNGTGGVGGAFYGGSSYTGNGGDGIDVSTGNLGTTREGYAANFTGDVRISENLYAGAKYFRVDHPLDPSNKYLNHVSTESSEMMNIYSGNITTDSTGNSTVTLPEWFETVNKDFRYQLTVVGQFAQAIIKSKIANGKFTIATNAPNVEVSWLITAVRQDVYAQAHPMVVEEAKPANERGFYIHPELYGQPMEKQTEWGRHPQLMRQMKDLRTQKPHGSLNSAIESAANKN